MLAKCKNKGLIFAPKIAPPQFRWLKSIRFDFSVRPTTCLFILFLMASILPCAPALADPETVINEFQGKPRDLPQFGGPSRLGRERGEFASPNNLMEEPFRGPGGPAERSLRNCRQKLRKISLSTIPNGRIAGFVLKAKNKRYAQGGFAGPGVACVEVRHEFRPQTVYGHILVIYRGGVDLEFPGLNKIVAGKIGKTYQELGDVGSWRSIRLQKANVSLTITNPPPSNQVIIQRRE